MADTSQLFSSRGSRAQHCRLCQEKLAPGKRSPAFFAFSSTEAATGGWPAAPPGWGGGHSQKGVAPLPLEGRPLLTANGQKSHRSFLSSFSKYSRKNSAVITVSMSARAVYAPPEREATKQRNVTNATT